MRFAIVVFPDHTHLLFLVLYFSMKVKQISAFVCVFFSVTELSFENAPLMTRNVHVSR